MISEVMLAPSGFTPENAVFPYLGTPKIDGIRFYVEHGDVWARSNRSIPNHCIRRDLQKFLPNGMDGELFYRDYNTTQSTVMSELTVPTVDLYIFDYITKHSDRYMDRVLTLQKWVTSLGWKRDETGYIPPVRLGLTGTYRIRPLYPVWIKNHAQFDAFYAKCRHEGHEGICLRDPAGPYREGRCTLAENYLVKYKPSEDREAVVLGVEELLVNNNELVTNELGRSKRSKARAGLTPGGTFGSFHVRDVVNEAVFHVGNGPGLTAFLRQQLWDSRQSLTGKIIRYRSMPYGAKDAPRQPQFIGFRDERDMS